MMSPASGTELGAPLLIANPAAGRGRDPVLPRLQAVLRAAGIDHDAVMTDGPGHASVLARDAVTEGRRYLVAVGGDGTVHEVVNGLVDAESGKAVADDLVLGLVSGGTGGDLTRTFGLDGPPEKAVRHLAGDATMPFDIGRVRLTSRDGKPLVRVFANIAEAGYGGLVTDLANRLPGWMGSARYAVAIPGSLLRFRLVETEVRLDHTSIREPLSNVVIANGQFFGGGLKVAPRALPDDGRYNVQVWRGKPTDVLRAGPDLRVGDHLQRPDVREWQSTTVEVAGQQPLLVEADGEVLGTTPATFDLLPGILRVKI